MKLWPVEMQCGRPTQAGTPCRRRRITPVGQTIEDVRSCPGHLTSEERKRLGYDQERESTPTAEQQERDFWLALDRPPACWLWAVDDDLDRSAPGLALREWQRGRCAICGSCPSSLVEDHSHATGMVRGLLCQSCNTREGLPLYRDEGPTVFSYYRRRPPVDIVQISYRYIHPLLGPDMGWDEPRPGDNAMRGVL